MLNAEEKKSFNQVWRILEKVSEESAKRILNHFNGIFGVAGTPATPPAQERTDDDGESEPVG